MSEVTAGQIALLVAAVALFAAGSGLSVARLWDDRYGLRVGGKACLYFGVLLAVAVLVWHSAARHDWRPLGDNFDTLIWLGLLLVLFVLYNQRRLPHEPTRPLRGLDWFVMPSAMLLLVLAAVFGRARPHVYFQNTWTFVHYTTSFAGALAFAVAGAAGCMFLFSSRRLRARPAAPGPDLGSLERLERLTFVSVTLGFALLSIGLVTGLALALNPGPRGSTLGPRWYASPKVLLAFGAWVIYALVMHSPINPSFRGRRAALLSVLGFALMVGVLVATQYMPQAGKPAPPDAGMLPTPASASRIGQKVLEVRQ